MIQQEGLTSWDDRRSIEFHELCALWPRPQAPKEAPFGICARRNSGPVPWQLPLNRPQAIWVDDTSRNLHALWSRAHLRHTQLVTRIPWP